MRKSTLVGGLAAALASMVLVLPPPAVSPRRAAAAAAAVPVTSMPTSSSRCATSTGFRSSAGRSGKRARRREVTCVQPISYAVVPGSASVVNPVDGRDVYLIPLVGEGSTADAPVVADTACDPQPAYLAFVSEAELERLNLVRTSDAVLWRKLVEVRNRLAGASAITLDGAGRITTWLGDVATPIDASPDQAAIYASTKGHPATPPPADGSPTNQGA